MSWDGDHPLADDEPLGRPFLLHAPGRTAGPDEPGPPGAPGSGRPGSGVRGAAPPRAPTAASGEPDQPPGGHQEVRPYLLTGGRTRTRGAAVAMETVVLSTGVRMVRGPDAAGLERARILQMCERPCSAAEVAAWLHVPLQVALVLMTDLVAEGLLDATAVAAGQSDDVLFLERLIAGVAAL